jgi:hypothetical protein
MEKAIHHIIHQAILKKISSDSEIQRIGKRFNIEINENHIQFIPNDEDKVLRFLARDDFSYNISIFAIAEHGYDHMWLADEENLFQWRKLNGLGTYESDNKLDKAQGAFAHRIVLQCGGKSCFQGMSLVRYEGIPSDLISFIMGRKEGTSGMIEVIPSEAISGFFDRMFNPVSAEKLNYEEIRNEHSQFSNAIKFLFESPLSDWRVILRYDSWKRYRKEVLEGIGTKGIVLKYWGLGLKDCPVLPIEEILFFFPELWLVVKEGVDLKRVYRVLNGCLGLDDYVLLQDHIQRHTRYMHELYRLSCFAWFPDIIEAEQDSVNWRSFSFNNHVDWTEEIIRKWAHKLDFEALSGNHSVKWTKELMRDYENRWSWEQLCENQSVPWDIDLIKCFEEHLVWAKLSGNGSLPWSGELLNEFEDRWIWKKHRSEKEKESPFVYDLMDWKYTVSHTDSKEYLSPWGAFNISSNEGIEWTPELLKKFESRLDVWVLAAKASLDASCVWFLYDKLYECRPAFRFTAKFSDFTPDRYGVSLTGWHLLFLNKNATIDASLLDKIYLMQFKATPDMAVNHQQWSGPRTLSVLELLFPKYNNSHIEINFDINLADCVEKSNTWGSKLMESAIGDSISIHGFENTERRFRPLLADVRDQLNTRRQELFDFKVNVWEQKRELLKDEFALKEIWQDLMSQNDFDESIRYLETRGAKLSVAEAYLSLFVLSCRHSITRGFSNVLQGFGLSELFNAPRFKAYEDVSRALRVSEQSEDTRHELYRINMDNLRAVKELSAFQIAKEYSRWWQTSDSKNNTAAEVVFLPVKSELNELLCSVLKGLGFIPIKDLRGKGNPSFDSIFLSKVDFPFFEKR